MIRQLVSANDPVLRQKAKTVAKVDKKVLALIKDMKETLRVQSDPEGVGLAAPQIGKSLAIFIMRLSSEDAKNLDEKDLLKAVINPQIVSVKKVDLPQKRSKKQILEGCLSLPHYYGPLTRSKEVKLEYTNEDGKRVTQTFTNFPAQIVLHEVDHLNGILFVDRLLEQKQPLYEYLNGTWTEVELV